MYPDGRPVAACVIICSYFKIFVKVSGAAGEGGDFVTLVYGKQKQLFLIAPTPSLDVKYTAAQH